VTSFGLICTVCDTSFFYLNLFGTDDILLIAAASHLIAVCFQLQPWAATLRNFFIAVCLDSVQVFNDGW
jgi:hypothetical protein